MAMNKRRKNIFETILTLGHDEDYSAPDPELPTPAAPGSIEKINVFCERLQRGEALWHPWDAKMAVRHEEQIEKRFIVKSVAKNTKSKRKQEA